MTMAFHPVSFSSGRLYRLLAMAAIIIMNTNKMASMIPPTAMHPSLVPAALPKLLSKEPTSWLRVCVCAA